MPKQLLGVFIWLCFFIGASAEIKKGNDIGKSPFFVDKVELTPGGRLMLHPRLPYVEGISEGDYTLILNLPEGVKLSNIRIHATDQNDRVDSLNESMREVVINGEKRMELSCKPDLAQATDGIAFQVCYVNKSGTVYIPTIKFCGTFDWKTFKKEIEIPDDNKAIVPLLLKWELSPPHAGTLWFGNIQISDIDTGKTVFDFQPKSPVIIKIGKGKSCYWLSEDQTNGGNKGDSLTLIPGKKYLITCKAKGEGMVSSFASTIKDALTKKVSYARTFVFDIDSGLSLPDKLLWRIEGKNGKVYEKGEVKLIAPIERIAPRELNTSTWICETWLQRENIPIQKLYIEKLYSWGLNMIEPEMIEPGYGTPLTKESLLIPIAREAREQGMKVRGRSTFVYGRSSGNYLKINPKVTAIGPRGEKTSFICPTYQLEPGNPWLKDCLDTIRKSIEINDLDGIFYDFEIPAAPYITYNPGNVKYPAAARAWRSPCMCERCRKAFQTAAGLDHVPNVEECCSDALYEKWVDFRCGQNIELWKSIKQAVKSVKPEATFSIYSGPPGDYTRQSYGVDWKKAAPYLDLAMQRDFCPFSPWVGKFKAYIDASVPKGQRTPEVFFQINAFPYSDQWMYGCDASKVYVELRNIKNHIVRTVAVYGSYGWSFTGIWGMDDQLTLPIKEANAILAKYEDYFVNGKKVDNKAKLVRGDVEIATWQLDKRFITFIFNSKAESQNVVLKMDDYKEASVEVNGRDCTVYEWPSKAWYDIF